MRARAAGRTTERWRRAAELLAPLYGAPAARRGALIDALGPGEEEVAALVRDLLASADGDTATTWAGEASASGDDPASPDEDAAPTVRVTGYRVIERIGSGGMASVYRAEGSIAGTPRLVALKVSREDSPTARRLFERERRLLARLGHPGIPRLLESGATEDGRPYAALELVEGLPLPRYCDLGRRTIRERLRLFERVCEAVEHAHRNLIVHRDLKPGNLLVTDDGRPQVLDFGIARDVRRVASERTVTGERYLTPAYASPEQLAGRPATTASDIYALGLILGELLTGSLPITPEERLAGLAGGSPAPEPRRPSQIVRALAREKGDGAALARAVAALRGTSLRRLARGLRGDLDTIVLHCLDADPEQRYASVAQLREDLRRHLASRPILARPAGLAERLVKLGRRRPALVSTFVLLALALSGWGWLTLSHGRDLAFERDAARQAQAESEAALRFLSDTFRLADNTQQVAPTSGREVTLRQAVDLAARRLGEDVPGGARSRARILVTLAEISVHLGEADRAVALAREGLALHRSLEPEGGIGALESLAILGEALNAAGDFQAAERELLVALAGLEETGAAVPPITRGKVYSHLVNAYQSLDDLAAARPLADRAVEVWREVAREQPLRLAESLADQGYQHWRQNRPEQAREAIEEALAILDEEVGGDHPLAAEALQHRAYLDAAQGRKEAARRAIGRALDLKRRFLGEDHPETLRTRSVVGEVLLLIDDLPAAEEAFRTSLELHRLHQGDRHPDVALDLNVLAATLLAQGKAADARDAARGALEISSEVWGEGSLVQAYHLATLGKALRALGEHAEATGVARRVLATRRSALPEGHQLVGQAALGLAQSLAAQGLCDEAVPLAREALAAFGPAVRKAAERRADARAVLASCAAPDGPG